MKTLILSHSQLEEMTNHVASCLPEEGCGLLAGLGNQVQLTIPITNSDHSAVRYNMEPTELVRAFYEFDAQGLEMLASYHSHPSGPGFPSTIDVSEFTYIGTSMLILSPTGHTWQAKGFEIQGEGFVEIGLQITK